jgi:Helix-turn-helix domain
MVPQNSIAAASGGEAADLGEITMTNAPDGFTFDTLLRKKIEKLRRKEKDVRVHNRLSAMLWLGQGRSPGEVAELLGVCPRTVRNWLELYQRGGLEALRTLEYKGDPG